MCDTASRPPNLDDQHLRRATTKGTRIVNAERMNAVAQKLSADLQTTDLPGLLHRMSEAMTNMANAPQEASYQATVSALRAELGSALQNSVVNTLSPVESQVLDEWGVSHLLGAALLEQIETAFDGNQFTIQTAQEEINRFVAPLQEFQAQLDQLVSALEGLHIGAEELEPGEFEIDVLLPRAAVRDELGELGKEFGQLERILLPFVELVTGSRPGITVRSVGSSDFTVYLAAAPGVAVCVSKAVDEVLKVYERVLDIRRTKAEIRALELDDPAGQDAIERAIDPLEDYANSAMQEGTTQIARALVEEYKSEQLPEGRPYQLEIEVNRSLLKIAERIDDGYNISVRVGELPPTDEEVEDDARLAADTAASPQLAEQVRAVEQRRGRSRSLMNLTGSPILSLEMPPAQTEDGTDAS